MNIEWTLQRRPTIAMRTTFGEIAMQDGNKLCDTLEDCVREVEGEPVASWKIYGETAIPAGRYQIVFVDSPHFGKDTLHLVDVPGFSDVHIHGGMSDKDTKACIIVGDRIDEEAQTISGAKLRGVLDRVKTTVRYWMAQGDSVWLTVRNA